MNCIHCANWIPDHSPFCNACGRRQAEPQTTAQQMPQQSGKMPKWPFLIIVPMVLIFVVFVGILLMAPKRMSQNAISQSNAVTSPSGLTGDKSAPAIPKECKDYLEVAKSSWRKDGFGTVVIWTVTFKNNSDKQIGDIKYDTVYMSETGNKVDAGGESSLLGDKTVQKLIPPQKTRVLEINDGFTHSAAAKASFSLVSCRFID